MMDLVVKYRSPDGGAGAGAPAAAAPAAGTSTTGVGPADAALEFKSRAGRKVTVNLGGAQQAGGEQPQAVQQIQAQQAEAKRQTPPAKERPSFDELVKGDYKEDFGKAVSAIVQDRLKHTKQAAETLEKLTPALEALLQKHGLKEGDYEGLVAKITDDDALYEDEALQRGIPVDTLKQMKKLEADKAQLQRMQAERMQEAQVQKHFHNLVTQGDALRQIYPSFDLNTELQNPRFFELTKPGVNVDVRTAYEVVHRDEIIGGAMQYTAEQTAQKLSSAMASGANRPSENGLSSSTGPINLNTDFRKMATEDRASFDKLVQAIKRGRA